MRKQDCFARVSGKKTESEEEAAAAAQLMLEQGVDTVLVKRGTSGSVQISKADGPLTQPIFPVDKVQHCPCPVHSLAASCIPLDSQAQDDL